MTGMIIDLASLSPKPALGEASIDLRPRGESATDGFLLQSVTPRVASASLFARARSRTGGLPAGCLGAATRASGLAARGEGFHSSDAVQTHDGMDHVVRKTRIEPVPELGEVAERGPGLRVGALEHGPR